MAPEVLRRSGPSWGYLDLEGPGGGTELQAGSSHFYPETQVISRSTAGRHAVLGGYPTTTSTTRRCPTTVSTSSRRRPPIRDRRRPLGTLVPIPESQARGARDYPLLPRPSPQKEGLTHLRRTRLECRRSMKRRNLTYTTPVPTTSYQCRVNQNFRVPTHRAPRPLREWSGRAGGDLPPQRHHLER